MEPVTRRTFLVLGTVSAAAAVAGGGAFLWGWMQGGELSPPDSTPESTELPGKGSTATLREPEVLTSTGGRLDLTLTAALTDVMVAGARVRALTYNGSLPGPTLRVRPGDRISLTFRNELDAPTNLHTHGLAVSPEGNGDNVFLMIEPGAAFDFEYRLGRDHPPGVFWYHPHHHGSVADQIFGGLYGVIIVDDETRIEADRERVMVISDIGFDGSGDLRAATPMDRMFGREGDMVLVNGQVGATLDARPGERERWRVVNACTSRHLRLRLDGQRMRLLGTDGGRYAESPDVDEIVLVPGNRADLMVTAVEGESVLRTLPFDRGSMGMMGGLSSATTGADLATFRVSGAAAPTVDDMPTQPTPRDLRLERMTGRRTLTLAMGGMMGMMGGGRSFTIDGREFDSSRVDSEVAQGALEEWTLVNTSTMDHPFHLHTWPMQLIEVAGVRAAGVDWRDVVPVPAGSSTVVRIPFEGVAGRSVYHCHILDHEDQGMMGVIRTG